MRHRHEVEGCAVPERRGVRSIGSIGSHANGGKAIWPPGAIAGTKTTTKTAAATAAAGEPRRAAMTSGAHRIGEGVCQEATGARAPPVGGTARSVPSGVDGGWHVWWRQVERLLKRWIGRQWVCWSVGWCVEWRGAA